MPTDSAKGRDHEPFRWCWCGPQFLGHSMTDPSVLVVRHRPPPDPRRRNEPRPNGEPYPAVSLDQLAPALRQTLAAWHDGATTATLLALRLGISPMAVDARLARLRDLELLPRQNPERSSEPVSPLTHPGVDTGDDVAPVRRPPTAHNMPRPSSTYGETRR